MHLFSAINNKQVILYQTTYTCIHKQLTGDHTFQTRKHAACTLKQFLSVTVFTQQKAKHRLRVSTEGMGGFLTLTADDSKLNTTKTPTKKNNLAHQKQSKLTAIHGESLVELFMFITLPRSTLCVREGQRSGAVK